MKVIAFDLSGIYWQAALGGAGKEDAEGPYRITLDTIRGMSDGFDRVVIAVDAERSFRQDLHPPYKAQRPERVEFQWEQLRRVIKACDDYGMHVFKADGFEADDILMTVAAWCAQNNHHCSVVSNDKDMAAVLGCGPDIALYRKNPKSGGWFAWTAEKFQEVAGYAAHRQPDFLAIAGDAADGFKFFPGIAEETARKLLQAYPTLEAIAGAAASVSDQNPMAVRLTTPQLKALQQDYATVYLKALEIATPRADVPLDLASLNTAREPAMPERQDDDLDDEDGASKTNGVIHDAPAKLAEQERKSVATMALATRDPRFELAPYAIQPDSLDDAWRLAKMAVVARLLPQWGLPEQATMVILAGRERGIPAFTALQNGYVVKGKLGWSAMLLAAQVASAPECEYFEIAETTPTYAVLRSKRRGRPEQRLKYTIEEAKQAGLFEKDGQWQKRPATMLRWAAFREAARAFWPERCVGMYTPAELRERFDDADAEVETAGEVS